MMTETAPVQELFDAPQHPYTKGLLRSIPTLESELKQPLPTLDYHPNAEQIALPLRKISTGHYARIA